MGIYAPVSLWTVLPEALLLLSGCAVLLLGLAGDRRLRDSVPWVTLLTLALAAVLLKVQEFNPGDAQSLVGGGLVFDRLAGYVRISALILGILLVLASWTAPTESERGEFFSMMLFSICGLMFVGSSNDLVILFLALELLSIPSYVLVTLSRVNRLALEAGTKYFYLGAMAAAVTAYGFSFLYGAAGTSQMVSVTGVPGTVDGVARLGQALADTGSLRQSIAVLGLVFSIGGLLFKIAAVPLHFYIADVYQGAANAVAGFLGFVPKLAGMVALAKVLQFTGWQTIEGGTFWLLWIVAALSMTVGNTLALMQTSIKRMLAYSGIAHSGYMLVGLLAGPLGGAGFIGDGVAAVLFYAVIYGIANLAAFALLGLLNMAGRPAETVRDVAGLLGRHPAPALLLALAMLTLMGLPPTPGFWGKLALFGSALGLSQSPLLAETAQQKWVVTLVIIAMINTAIGAAYYLRVIAAVLLYENDEPAEPAPREAQTMSTMLCGILMLVFTFFPNLLMQAGRIATDSLREGGIDLTPRRTADGGIAGEAPRPHGRS